MISTRKKAFSLLEVIVATGILSMTVFWVYKLIGENVKISERSDDYIYSEILLTNLENCIDNIGFDYFYADPQNTYEFQIGNNWELCSINTWISTTLNGTDYALSGDILIRNTSLIKWRLKLDSSWVVNKTTFSQYKK